MISALLIVIAFGLLVFGLRLPLYYCFRHKRWKEQCGWWVFCPECYWDRPHK